MRTSPVLFELDDMEQRPTASSAADYEYERRVSDTQYMMEALHGTSAAMACVAIACDRMVDGDAEASVFWMCVYRAILSADPLAQYGAKHLH